MSCITALYNSPDLHGEGLVVPLKAFNQAANSAPALFMIGPVVYPILGILAAVGMGVKCSDIDRIRNKNWHVFSLIEQEIESGKPDLCRRGHSVRDVFGRESKRVLVKQIVAHIEHHSKLNEKKIYLLSEYREIIKSSVSFLDVSLLYRDKKIILEIYRLE